MIHLPGACASLFLGIAALAILPNPAPGQTSGAALEVTVRDGENRRPLAGARVHVEGLGIPGLADAGGVVHFDDLPAGSRFVEARYLGYASRTYLVTLEPGRIGTLEIVLPPDPIPVAEVSVRADPGALEERGFHDRRRRGSGTFITRADIERLRLNRMSDVLRRAAGINLATATVSEDNARASSQRQQARPNSCPIQIYVDGVPRPIQNVDEIRLGMVEAIEIFRGSASLPISFAAGNTPCGAILVWTRVAR